MVSHTFLRFPSTSKTSPLKFMAAAGLTHGAHIRATLVSVLRAIPLYFRFFFRFLVISLHFHHVGLITVNAFAFISRLQWANADGEGQNGPN